MTMFLLLIYILIQNVSSNPVSYTTIDYHWDDDYQTSSWYSSSSGWYQSPGWQGSTQTTYQNQINYHGPFNDDSYELYRDFRCAHHSQVNVKYDITFCGNSTDTIDTWRRIFPSTWKYQIQDTLSVDIDVGYTGTSLQTSDDCSPWNYDQITQIKYPFTVKAAETWRLYFDLDVEYFNYVALYNINIYCYPFATTSNPTPEPTPSPTPTPTQYPSKSPTNIPSITPTKSPTKNPSKTPTRNPTGTPSKSPTAQPTFIPTIYPTTEPTTDPTIEPTMSPTTPSPTLVDRVTNNPTSLSTTITQTNDIMTTKHDHKSKNNDSMNKSKVKEMIIITLSVIALCCAITFIVLLIKCTRQSTDKVTKEFDATAYVQLMDHDGNNNNKKQLSVKDNDSDDDIYNYSHPTPHSGDNDSDDDLAMPDTLGRHSTDRGLDNVVQEGDDDDEEVLIGLETLQ